MIMLSTLKTLGITGRDVILFDTFDDMTEASDFDYDDRGVADTELLEKEIAERERFPAEFAASEDEVRSNLQNAVIARSGSAWYVVTYAKPFRIHRQGQSLCYALILIIMNPHAPK